MPILVLRGAQSLLRRGKTLVRALLLLQLLPLIGTLIGVLLFRLSGCALEGGVPSCPPGSSDLLGQAGYAMGFSALFIPMTLGIGVIFGLFLLFARLTVRATGAGGEG